MDENGSIELGGDEAVARIDRARLSESGDVVRFDYEDRFGEPTEGVVVRVEGELVAFRNVCPHLGDPLDGRTGEFLAERGGVLVCDSHGARFEPRSGRCEAGPCEGERLEKLSVEVDESEEEVVVRRTGRFSI